MNLLCRTSLSQVGNSQAVIIPKKYLKTLKIHAKAKVDLYQANDGIFMRPVAEWSVERQREIIDDILAYVNSAEDDEPIPGDFIETYCHEQDIEEIDWEGAWTE